MPGTILSHVYRRNRTRVLKAVRGRGDGPWMRPREEDLVQEILLRLQPRRCLEWGAGLSTLHFPALLSAGESWLAIEHDAEWAQSVATANVRHWVSTVHIPPDHVPWTDAHGDGDATDLRAYIDYAARRAPFDFIFIDGRARAECVRRSRTLLAPGGVVVLHDANRSFYDASFASYPNQLLFRDSRASGSKPDGGVWIGSIDRRLDDIVDVSWHDRVWQFYKGIGRVVD